MSGMKLIMENWRSYLKEEISSIKSPLSPEQSKFLHLLSSYGKEEEQEDLSILTEQELNEGVIENIKKWFSTKLEQGASKEELEAEYIDEVPDPERREVLRRILLGLGAAAATAPLPAGLGAAFYKQGAAGSETEPRIPMFTPRTPSGEQPFTSRAKEPPKVDSMMPVDEFEWSPSPATGLLWVTPAQIPDDYILPSRRISAGQYKNELITRKIKGSEKDYYDISSLEKSLFGNQGVWAYTRRKGMQAFDIHPDFKAPMLPLIWSKMFEVYAGKLEDQIRQVRALSQTDLEELARQTNTPVEDILSRVEEIENETVKRLEY